MNELSLRKEILDSLEPILRNSQDVSVNREVLDIVVDLLIKSRPSDWSEPDVIFKSEDSDKVMNYFALFSALSFCYWTDDGYWYKELNGNKLGGSYSLFYSLKNAIEHGLDITDADVLASMSEDTFREIVTGSDGKLIPFFRERYNIAVEIGQILRKGFDGKFSNLFRQCDNNASKIVRSLVKFPCFRDVQDYHGSKLKFYKKPQEVLTLIYEYFHGSVPGDFTNMDDLSVSSDYRLPQILNALGVLTYSKDLENKIKANVVFPEGSLELLEIRSNTILSGELLRDLAYKKGSGLSSAEISNRLWTLSHEPTYKSAILSFPRMESVFV